MDHCLGGVGDIVESRGVTWDESVITEHNKLRGTRRKIDEPKTPFRSGGGGSVGSACSDDSMGAPVSAERVAAALSGEAGAFGGVASQRYTPQGLRAGGRGGDVK